jgi:transaldolase
MNPLLQLRGLGQRVWLDNLSRTLLRDGTLARLVSEDGVAGVTSNPAIFFKAISESPHYRDELAALRRDGTLTAEQRYERLAIPDIQAACDLLRSAFDASAGEDGWVSLEVSPFLAHDADATVTAARRLRSAVARDNLLIKVPATAAGLTAIETLIAEGISVNVTLMFSLKHVDDVAAAYTRGLKRWAAGGGDPRRVKSVASVFLSRIDTLVDKRLEALGGDALALRGKAGVALAKLAYRRYGTILRQEATRVAPGARPQFLLWASTGTKNAAYSDVMYVEPLIGPETINTLPDATLAAFRDHGRATASLTEDIGAAQRQFAELERLGIGMNAVGEELQVEGVRLFEEAFANLLQLAE